MHTRQAVVIHEEDFSSLTILKPFSEEYINFLYLIEENAYGDFHGNLITKDNLKKRLNFNDEEFAELLNKLTV